MGEAVKASTSLTLYSVDNSGTFGISLNSNQPVHQIYDPNTNTYQPNYATNSLKITPTIMRNTDALSPTDSHLTVTWKRQEGSGSEGNLTAGETVSGGVLTVNQNKLSSVASGIITYICYVTYTNAQENVTLNDRDSLTFTLVKNANEVHDISVIGDNNVFLYNSAGSLKSAGQITLTATATNVNISTWQYKKSDGTWASYPTTSDNATITGSTLIVKPSHSIFFNDVAVIKILTDDVDVYDTITITKLHDGAVGKDAVIATLTNESHSLPANSAGTVSSYNGAVSTLLIYEGLTDKTSTWTITTTASTGITGTQSDDKKTFTVTGMTVDTGYVDFAASKSGYTSITKRFALTRVKAGSNGTAARVYELTSSTIVINKNISNVLTPSSITFSSYYRDGNSATRNAYSGRFIIEESTDGTTFSAKYTSSANEATKVYTPSASNLSAIRCTLYAAGGTTTALDSQTVIITQDGKTGATGAAGKDSISVIVGNESQVIPCNSSGNILAALDVTIPFYGYKGTTRVGCTVTPGTLPSGVTIKSNTPATASVTGNLILTFAANGALGASATKTGTIDLSFTCEGQSVVKKFTWTKANAAVNGTSSVLFEVLSPAGNVIINGQNNVQLTTIMYSGTSQVTPTAFVWKKYNSGAWTTISGQTASTLTVTPDMVDSSASFSCTATYGGKTYTAYATVLDKQDNYQASLISTAGEAFKNSVGTTVLYSLVYQNGKEVDVLKSMVFSSTAPSSSKNGDFYWKINTSAGTVTLQKYTGTAWEDATGADLPQLKYNIYRTNANNEIMDEGEIWKSGKAVYFDASGLATLPQKKCNFILQVTD